MRCTFIDPAWFTACPERWRRPMPDDGGDRDGSRGAVPPQTPSETATCTRCRFRTEAPQSYALLPRLLDVEPSLHEFWHNIQRRRRSPSREMNCGQRYVGRWHAPVVWMNRSHCHAEHRPGLAISNEWWPRGSGTPPSLKSSPPLVTFDFLIQVLTDSRSLLRL